jgi:3',5'-cyclic AMP phosphodiesterase CpdA
MLHSLSVVGAVQAQYRIAVISDLNSAYGSLTYTPLVDSVVNSIVHRWKPNLVLCAGDVIAGQKASLSDDHVNQMWLHFHQTVAQPLTQARIPLVVSMGNHDASPYPNHARDRMLADRYWNTLFSSEYLQFNDKARFPFVYSQYADSVFIAVWDASSERISDENLKWLKQELGSPKSQQARFRFVLGHLPLYGVAQGRDTRGNILADADILRMELERLSVDLYISGHHHAYYRGRHTYLDMLFAGALGTGPRSLLDGTPPRNTITLLDLDLVSGKIEEETIDLNTGQRIDPNSLPPYLETLQGRIYRR